MLISTGRLCSFCGLLRRNPKIFAMSRYSSNKSEQKQGWSTSSKRIAGGVGAGCAVLALSAGVWYLQSDSKVLKPTTPIPSLSERLDHLDGVSHIPYVMIGGGTAAMAAAKSLKGEKLDAKILMISDEMHPPYLRPPLSKESWNSPEDLLVKRQFQLLSGRSKDLFYFVDEFYLPLKETMSRDEEGGISLARGLRVTGLDQEERQISIEHGAATLTYDKCLIATGSRPKRLTTCPESERLRYFRSLDDFDFCRSIVNDVEEICVVGGGPLGCELAVNIASANPSKKVTLVNKHAALMPKILPGFLSAELERLLTSELKNLTIRNNSEVKSSDSPWFQIRKSISLHLGDNETMKSDFVIMAIGSDRNVDFAKSGPLAAYVKDDSILVGSDMAVCNGLYAAGDVAMHKNLITNRETKFEHLNEASISGRVAGQNMANGGGKPMHFYNRSSFWCDLADVLQMEACGLVDARSLETFSVFESSDESKYSRGCVFYVDSDETIVGMVLWNMFDMIGPAQAIVEMQPKVSDAEAIMKQFCGILDERRIEFEQQVAEAMAMQEAETQHAT